MVYCRNVLERKLITNKLLVQTNKIKCYCLKVYITYPCGWQCCCWAGWCRCHQLLSLQQCTVLHSAGHSRCRRWCWWDKGGCGYQAQLPQQCMFQRHRWAPSWRSPHLTHTVGRLSHYGGYMELGRETMEVNMLSDIQTELKLMCVVVWDHTSVEEGRTAGDAVTLAALSLYSDVVVLSAG